MAVNKVTLSNAGNVDILIALNDPTDANRPPPTHSIKAQHSETHAVGLAGTSNLFIWINGEDDPIWEGIIPTNIEKVITIYPEQEKVMYDRMVLPLGFMPITDTSSPGFTKVEKPQQNTRVPWMLCISILALVLLIWFMWIKTK